MVASEAGSTHLEPQTLVMAFSQSGETADVLRAVELLRAPGNPVLAVTNAPHSTLARTADAVLPCHAGPEIGVAATKTFTAQVLTGTGVGNRNNTIRRPDFNADPTEFLALPGYPSRNFRDQFVATLPVNLGGTAATQGAPGPASNAATFNYAPIAGERDTNGFQRIDDPNTSARSRSMARTVRWKYTCWYMNRRALRNISRAPSPGSNSVRPSLPMNVYRRSRSTSIGPAVTPVRYASRRT